MLHRLENWRVKSNRKMRTSRVSEYQEPIEYDQHTVYIVHTYGRMTCLLIILLVSSGTDGACGFEFRNRTIICLFVFDVCLSLCIFPYTRITYNRYIHYVHVSHVTVLFN